MHLIAVFILLVFVYSLFSQRLKSTIITGPIMFTLAGMAVMLMPSELREFRTDKRAFLMVAEIGLVLLLFSDASKTNLSVLKSIRELPVRLLTTGMLLTIALGFVAGLLALPNLNIWEAGILAAILAPTDAGLGQVIVNSPRVPMRVREALNVEAGLNDGLSVPFMMLFIALAAASEHISPGSVLARYLLEQLGYGALIGAVIGFGGGYLLSWARRNELMDEPLQQLGFVSLPLLCLFASEAHGASMFIAAFVAGIAVQIGYKNACEHSVEFTEDWGQLLNFFVFFLFGLVTVREIPNLRWEYLVYAVLSLTVVRMVPVALALAGTKLGTPTVLFMGWFGPRGLASIVLGLVFLEHEAKLTGENTIRLCVMLTVLLSILLHGASALPGIDWYARRVKPDDGPIPSS